MEITVTAKSYSARNAARRSGCWRWGRANTTYSELASNRSHDSVGEMNFQEVFGGRNYTNPSVGRGAHNIGVLPLVLRSRHVAIAPATRDRGHERVGVWHVT